MNEKTNCRPYQGVSGNSLSAHNLDIFQSGDQPQILQSVQDLDTALDAYFMRLFSQFRKEGCTNSPVFQFWDMFLEAVQLLLWNIRAEREGNWALHMHTQVTMLPYMFAANRFNYARWMLTYILDMADLQPRLCDWAYKRSRATYRKEKGLQGII